MTATPDSTTAPAATSTWDSIAVYLRPRVLIVMFLGFSSGLPLALTGTTLQIWSTQSNVDLKTIGFFTLVGTPYTLKFLWAPIVDAVDIPMLSRLLGRRRGWLVFSQLLLMAAIVFLAFCDPAISPWYVAFGALLVAMASATQDIVIDAFRVESLDKSEQAAGVASYVAAYRVGMLVSGAGVLYLVAAFELYSFANTVAWKLALIVMAVLVLIGIATTLAATEPAQSAAAEAAHAGEKNSVARVAQAAYRAFADFLTRDAAIVVLLFVVLYKFCDAFAGAMTAAFVIKIGFSIVDYANIVKGVGLAASLIGGFAGGMLAARYSIVTCLWVGAALQTISNLAFTWLAFVGTHHWALTAAIIAENFTGAIGTVILVAYLSALCQSPLHTATQFALLTALAAVGRTYLAAPAGIVAEATGWPMFFVVSSLVAIPSLLLLAWLQQRGHFAQLGPTRVTRADD
ncbi:MAG: MFS transporter [Xanthobacteraceae bacterium]|nr:MFS transporter [Xanthobacteraceae bacterium]